MSLNTASTPNASVVLNIAHPQETEDCCNMHRSNILYRSTQKSPLACNIMCYNVQNNFRSTVLVLALVSSQYEHTFSFTFQQIAGQTTLPKNKGQNIVVSFRMFYLLPLKCSILR